MNLKCRRVKRLRLLLKKISVSACVIMAGVFYGGIVYQFVVFFHIDLSHFYISLLQNTLFISTTAFMLLGLEIFPLGLHLSVQFQFRITFGILETKFLIDGDKVGEQ